MNKGPL